jgi:putative DNA primase/helicase
MSEAQQSSYSDRARRKIDEEDARSNGVDREISRLAVLPLVEYERERKAAAEALGVRASILDKLVQAVRPAEDDNNLQGQALTLPEPEPWSEPVEGAELLQALTEIFERYLVLAEGAAVALTLWSVHSFAHDLRSVSPILAVTSPQKRCGKTRTLDVLAALVLRPLTASNITASALFRVVEKSRPTLLVDEADTFLDGADELRGILNSGHTRSSARVIRTAGDAFEPRMFSTWAPKAIAKIGRLTGTLADRSIHVRMARKLRGDSVESIREGDLDRLADLPRKASRWVSDHAQQIRQADPEVPRGLHDRAADNWRPLLAIADLAGGEWPELARRAIHALSDDDDADDSASIMLLEDIRALFAERGADRLASSLIVENLHALEHRPWPEWKNGRPITVRQVATLLRPFKIRPKDIRLADPAAPKDNAKGYQLAQFADAFRRYLDPEHDPRHRDRLTDTEQTDENDPRQANNDVTDRNSQKAAPGNACHAVTDREPDPKDPDLADVERWLDDIGERDPELRQEVLDKCRADPEALAKYLALGAGLT